MGEPERQDLPDPIRDHRRQWRDCLYVYPVISRRSRGLSIGVNLNPDKACNFRCLYCQIDRTVRRDLHTVDLGILRRELHLAVSEAVGGRLWAESRFAATTTEMRRINDIALSGDGEPTCVAELPGAVRIAAEARRESGLDDLKLVLITNASRLDDEPFQRARGDLWANNGEIWAKLDAGTEAYFRTVNRPAKKLSLARILDNILSVAVERPVVIQTLLCRIDGRTPAPGEIEAYCGRLRKLMADGGRIGSVQLHTLARAPASGRVSFLPPDELDAIAETIRRSLGPVPVAVYYGADVAPQ